MPKIYDLRSDTAIQPTEAMIASLRGNYFSDDLLLEDDPTNRLLDHVSREFGKESAIITPSGTMSNQIAAAVISRPGAEVVVGQESHIYNLEAGGLAANSGVQVRAVPVRAGEYSLPDIESALRSSALQVSPTTGILLESTYNLNAGYVSSLENLRSIGEMANRHGAFVYMDGARVFNAAVKLGVPLREITKHVDALQICLTKGLGGPLGSVLIGSEEFIQEARLVRQRMGGGMRHTGFIAGPGLMAFDDWTTRIAADHVHAKLLEDALRPLNSVDIINGPVETNILAFALRGTGTQVKGFVNRLAESRINVKPISPDTFRAVTHSTLDTSDIRFCAAAIVAAIRESIGN